MDGIAVEMINRSNATRNEQRYREKMTSQNFGDRGLYSASGPIGFAEVGLESSAGAETCEL